MPVCDKVLIDQLIKEMQVKEFPCIVIIDQHGDIVSNTGTKDMLELDIERLRKKWNKDLKIVD